MQQIIDAIDAVNDIQNSSVDFYRTIENATYSQIPQTLTVVSYNEVGIAADDDDGLPESGTSATYRDDIVCVTCLLPL